MGGLLRSGLAIAKSLAWLGVDGGNAGIFGFMITWALLANAGPVWSSYEDWREKRRK